MSGGRPVWDWSSATAGRFEVGLGVFAGGEGFFGSSGSWGINCRVRNISLALGVAVTCGGWSCPRAGQAHAAAVTNRNPIRIVIDSTFPAIEYIEYTTSIV